MREKNSVAPAGAMVRIFAALVDVERAEIRAVVLSFAYFFFILSSYYVIRPLRDEIGAAGGLDNLPWLYTGTLTGMLLANPIFSALVSRMPRRRFIPIIHRFFIANLLLFYLLLPLLQRSGSSWTERIFFVWTSIFNLFIVSVFWAFMADAFSHVQSKRLFGFISAGGTLGGIVGAALTALLVQKIGQFNLLLISVALLELSVHCVRFFPAHSKVPADSIAPETREDEEERPIQGRIMAGVAHVFSSPYLLLICSYTLLYTITSTFLYFQQADIISRSFADRGARTAFFAKIDLAVNILTVVAQLLFTGRIMRSIGVSAMLAMLPLISLIGFSTIGLLPTLLLVVIFQVTRRVGNFALARPAREVLFTVIKREDKYKAKNFIDTFVYRTGDQIGAWSSPLIGKLGLGIAGLAMAAAPLAAIWLVIGIWLGRRQAALAESGN